MTKYLVITGASSGIGYATAQLFEANGYTVINLSRRAADANWHQFSCDLSQLDSVASCCDALKSLLTKSEYSVIIHNASDYRQDSAGHCAAEDLQRTLTVNVVAPSLINQQLLPHLNDGSSILYVGSTLAEKAVPGCYSYVTSKHAVLGAMRATAQDLAGRSIHTACICPGFTRTAMLEQHLGNDQEQKAFQDFIASKVTQQRLIEPQEIARTLLFCAENAVINGSVIHCNLGQVES